MTQFCVFVLFLSLLLWYVVQRRVTPFRVGFCFVTSLLLWHRVQRCVTRRLRVALEHVHKYHFTSLCNVTLHIRQMAKASCFKLMTAAYLEKAKQFTTDKNANLTLF
jgi:hypothetical protein